jgi:hypothetical protein
MKAIVLFFALIISTFSISFAQQGYEFMQVTAVESVVPAGLGRSRLLTTDPNGQVVEKELKNFFSAVGINFGNIANNDRVIAARVQEYANEGWELINITSGVYGAEKSTGIFITRYFFRRKLN